MLNTRTLVCAHDMDFQALADAVTECLPVRGLLDPIDEQVAERLCSIGQGCGHRRVVLLDGPGFAE